MYLGERWVSTREVRGRKRGRQTIVHVYITKESPARSMRDNGCLYKAISDDRIAEEILRIWRHGQWAILVLAGKGYSLFCMVKG